jgi:predicted AlkP superfamily phosphohydrolase/phosphomutase
VKVPLNLKVDRAKHEVEVTVQGTTTTLRETEWSDWVEVTFEVTPKYSVSAISRFYPMEIGEHVTIYMSCLQFHPSRPYMRLTTPPTYGAELEKRYGLFKTIGWIYDTHALRLDAMTEQVFLDDVQQTMAWRAQLTLDEIDRGNFDLLVSAWTGTDRTAHMFWRYRDPEHALYTPEGAAQFGAAVEDTYRHMDQIVGKVMAKLSDDDLLLIISDHGFHSFRKGFNVNTWLIRNGYLAVTGTDDPETAHNPNKFLDLGRKPGRVGYDWANSRAYSIGLGSIFLNLKGREGKGTVEPGDADSLIAEIRSKLLDVVDPENGAKVFNEVYTRDVYKGSASAEAPDIQLGYAEGYQSTKATVSGVAPKEVFEVNDDKWSGEHAASDRESSRGILFSNKPFGSSDPEIIDIGVTALSYLGKNVPSDFEGKNIF